MYEIISGGDGKVMVMDRWGQIAWYPANVLRAGTLLGFFAYNLFGKPHAAVGPAPPPGASNPKFTWHPGKPVPNAKATPKVAAEGAHATPAPLAVTPASAAHVAIDEAWQSAVNRAYGRHGRVLG